MTTLVLLPGMDGTGALFAPFLQELSRSIRPQVISYPPNEQLGYAELVAHVEKALPKNEDYVLLGESFSGPIAATLAGRRPARLCGLILVCSFVSTPLRALAPFRRLARLLPSPTLALAPLSLALMGRHGTPSLRRSLSEALAAVEPAVLRHRAEEALDASASESMSSVTCPVLYLQAVEDRVVPPRCGAEVKHLCPQAEVVQLQGPHFLLQTQAAAAAACIELFLRQTQNAA